MVLCHISLELNNKVKDRKILKVLYDFGTVEFYDELTNDDNQILDLGAKSKYTKIIKKIFNI